ncbi:hypothetical protein AMTRI_Chr02g254010 [Amborella trichopoda]
MEYVKQLIKKKDQYSLPLNAVTLNSLVGGFCMHGNLQQSLQLLDELRPKGLSPNIFTYAFLLAAAYKGMGLMKP